MGRKAKPDLSADELAAIEGKGHRIAAAIVSEMRGANVASITHAESYRRSVSHQWVATQRKIIHPSKNPGVEEGHHMSNNPQATGNAGPRIVRNHPDSEQPPTKPSENPSAYLNGQVSEEDKPVHNQVESEHSGAAR